MIAVFNSGDAVTELAARIRSLVSLPGVDAVVVDDGSSPADGLALLSALTADRDAPGDGDITLISRGDNAGVAFSRNEALREARGDFVWFVDHDDDWSREGLSALRRHAAGADIVVAGARFRWGPGPTQQRPVDGVPGLAAPRNVGSDEGARLLLAGRFQGFLWSKLFRRSILATDPFPLQRAHSDVVGVAHAVAAAHTIRLIPEIVYTYRRSPGSLTRSRAPEAAVLESAHDQVVATLVDRVSRSDLDAFTAWFLCLGAVKTAVRWAGAPSALAEAVAVASVRGRRLSLRSVARRSLPLLVVIVLLRTLPAILPGVIRAAFSALELGRAARARFAPGSAA